MYDSKSYKNAFHTISCQMEAQMQRGAFFSAVLEQATARECQTEEKALKRSSPQLEEANCQLTYEATGCTAVVMCAFLCPPVSVC